ncbi:MAG: hypothetical protein H6Q81_2577 [Deltaproteobacteria bacterium]|nr:hypothetical protein [Deltaproteobacteria bacterium]
MAEKRPARRPANTAPIQYVRSTPAMETVAVKNRAENSLSPKRAKEAAFPQ